MPDAPVLPTILRLAWPGIVLVAFQSAVSIADTHFVGRLGTAPLAGLALVFPLVMLLQMMSAGAMGGGVSAAIARALGAKNHDKARSLVAHAVVLALAVGASFAVIVIVLGPPLFRLLGGRGAILEHAITYAAVLFAGAPIVFLANFSAAALRGMGNTIVPAVVLSVAAIVHVPLCGALTLGLGVFPQLGIAGAAVAYVVAFGLAAFALLVWLARAQVPAPLRLRGMRWARAPLVEMFAVGGLSSLSALQTVTTAVVLTGLVGRFGPEALAGYGVGVRLELLQVPISFAVGAALVPLVGMNVGARQFARAKRIAWTGAAIAACITGSIGAVLAVVPDLWLTLFSSDPAVLEAGRTYLRTAGPVYFFIGMGVALYFASQGPGRVGWPVLAGTARLIIALGAGWLALAAGGGLQALFVVVALGLAAWGGITAIAVARTSWER